MISIQKNESLLMTSEQKKTFFKTIAEKNIKKQCTMLVHD